MKQILPILTLTTLTAAAFADASAPAAAAPAGLVYNRVTVQQNTSGETNRNITVENLINGSNVLVGLTQAEAGGGSGNIALGYVFKNVTNGIDATVSITSGSYDGASVNLRRSLSEVLAGLELAVGYGRFEGSNNYWNYEVSYNINKQFSVAFAAYDVSDSNQKFVALRYNY
jgi:hypothetical protein